MADDYNFQKLTPVSDADISVYEDAFKFVFENADVKNVAVSGAYSAGKSSILKSFKAKHPDKRFVHLSLAYFRSPEREDLESIDSANNTNNILIKESVLEGKILNQLIHQIPADKIPQTNFRVKKDAKPNSLIKSTVAVSLFIGVIFFLFFSDKIAIYIKNLPESFIKLVLFPLASQYMLIPATFILIACSILFIFSLIKTQKNKNIFRKISLQGNEIEIFEETEDSYFDKYLNEVLYLFEKVDADVIVFEDMDRFNTSRIFERLREVNTLVNLHRKKECGNKYFPLRFFYLLRDDIFISKDRTKFFDYIIPIVPVVDSSNSYEQFIKHLKKGGLFDNFDQKFLQSLSLYVDDMRILKNIYNEFVIYFNRLNITDLDCNKMLAIISYKNLFPRDFNDLQLTKGFVHDIFAQKESLIQKNVDSIQAERIGLSQRIDQAKNEALTSQEELDDAYLMKKNRIQQRNGGLSRAIQEQFRGFDIELAQRKQSLKDRDDANLAKLESKLNDVDNKIAYMKTKALKDLITRENIDSVFSVVHINEIGETEEFNSIKCSDYFSLLKFLIRNGFIDETYSDYMTYFYEDSLSAIDKTFLRRVTDKRGADYYFALKEPKKVIDSPILRKVDFEQEETLNFDLLNYLLQNNDKPKYAAYIKTLITQIQKTENFDFVSKYYGMNNTRSQFVMGINAQWESFFFTALKQQVLPANQIRQFSIDTLCFCNDDTIKAINIENCLTSYISKSSDFLAIENSDVKKLMNGFSLIGVLFVDIDYECANKSLFDEVYQRCFYELNYTNITLMLRNKYLIESDADIIHRNYTLVQRHAESPLAVYISENISSYLEIVLSNCNRKINDSEQIAASLLNNVNLSYSLKEQYIVFLSTVITDITDIVDANLWTAMLNCRIVEFSVNNFINYFLKHTIDEAVLGYLNSEPAEVDFSSASCAFNDEIAENLFDAVSICNEISTEKYRKILIDLNFYFDNYSAEGIADDKFNVLICEKLLQMNENSLKFVREKYLKHIFIFIENNLDEYLGLQKPEIFRMDETLMILNWDFDDEKKLKLLELTDECISVIGKGYSDRVNSYLIKNNLENEDLPSLYRNYLEYGNQTQTIINELAIADTSEIIERKMSIDDSLLSVLLKSEGVIRTNKIALFTLAIPNLNEYTCIKHFEELGLNELIYIFTKGGSRRKYDKNNEVTAVFSALKNHRWIYNYWEDEKNNEKYHISKSKPKTTVPEFLD